MKIIDNTNPEQRCFPLQRVSELSHKDNDWKTDKSNGPKPGLIGDFYPFELYHDNGQLEEKGYSRDDDQVTLEFTAYHRNGNLNMEGFYEQGKEVGHWKFHDESGKLETICVFRDGAPSHWRCIIQDGISHTYFKNGQLKGIYPYKNGKQNGVWKEFHSSGRLRGIGIHKDDIRDGIWEEFFNYKNRPLSRRMSYTNGQIGLWEEYYSNGQPRMITTYKEDEEEIGGKTFFEDGQQISEWCNQ